MSRPGDLHNASMTVRLGIAGLAMLVIGVPATFGLIISPISHAGFDAVLDGLITGLILGIPVVVGTPIALLRRPRWGRRWAAAVSAMLLIGWAVDLVIALGYPLGLLHPGLIRSAVSLPPDGRASCSPSC